MGLPPALWSDSKKGGDGWLEAEGHLRGQQQQKTESHLARVFQIVQPTSKAATLTLWADNTVLTAPQIHVSTVTTPRSKDHQARLS